MDETNQLTQHIPDAIISEIDRHARAYGWEIANRGIAPTEQVELTPENPFADLLWRTHIQKADT